MSAPLFSIVEGWSGALPFTLKADDEPFDLSGLTVSILLKNADGTMVKNTTEGVTVTAATVGELQYEPSTSTGDLFLAAQTPYRVRFKVTDAFDKVAFFPNDEEELIEVNPL
jgi:hypothetical protein